MKFKNLIVFILFLVIYSCQNSIDTKKTQENENKEQKEELTELELIKENPIKQLESSSLTRFDLSGICISNDSLYIVADKAWNKAIYKIETLGKKINISSEKEICISGKIDFEGIDADDTNFYIINERKSEVYLKNKHSCSINILNIDWKQINIKPKDWKNKGLEGIALDKENQILYLIKERGSRKIFSYNLQTSEIKEPFKELFDKKDGDFTDAKFENGKLYILERNASSILRIDVKTKESYSVSIKNILNPQNKRLYETDNLEYGTAEALLLTKKEIWIGIDNNGEETSSYGQKLGLEKNNKPAIIVFKRPEKF